MEHSDNILSIENNITYLGVEISGPTNRNHSAKRVRCARQAFYALQNAGLKYQGVSLDTAMTIIKSAVNSTLLIWLSQHTSKQKASERTGYHTVQTSKMYPRSQ